MAWTAVSATTGVFSALSGGDECPVFASVIPLVGGELGYSVDDDSPALVCDVLPIPVTDGNVIPSNFTTLSSASTGAYSTLSGTDVARQFYGIGSIDQGAGDVDFVLSVDEDRIFYLGEGPPYVLVQEVMEAP